MRSFLVAFLFLALAYPADASHCAAWWTANPEVDAAGVLYVDYDPAPPKGLGALWIYQESNGILGLQRDDDVYSTTCHGQVAGDTIIF